MVAIVVWLVFHKFSFYLVKSENIPIRRLIDGKMEVGAVKHKLNNEIIQIKKKMNQAKVQIIHKLTRKAGTLKNGQKKAPEQLRAKLQRKADAAVAEVLLIKKVKAKELIRFAISHKGTLQEHINKSAVDIDKAFAKILTHKAMTEKYRSLREVFVNMPVDQLLMTRKERLKIKKAKKDASKNKNDSKDKQKNTHTHVEEDRVNSSENVDNGEENPTDGDTEGSESGSDKEFNSSDSVSSMDIDKRETKTEVRESNANTLGDDNTEVEVDVTTVCKEIKKVAMKQKVNKTKDNHFNNHCTIEPKLKNETKPKPKTKKPTKKSLKTSKVEIECHVPAPAKVVDSFFLTATGDHYMTLAEPRPPDEVKEDHHRGNRRTRRAEKFGKPIKPSLNRQFKNSDSDYRNNKSKFAQYEKSHINANKNDSFKKSDILNRKEVPGRANISIDTRKADIVAEKLHPSWEAKKQKSGIVPFQGKKVVF